MAIDVNALKGRLTLLQKKADLILAAAERETRALTDDEKSELSAIEKEMDALAGRIEKTERETEFTEKLTAMTPGGTGAKGRQSPALDGLPARGESWGRTFTSHAAIAEFLKAGLPGATSAEVFGKS